ncbi:PAQR family membrane homeostasis protein TrhA [Oleispirillum naphthae]|uniref:PAQR family membrane homeostasis protein TrhA n=1 Tax=Oleispirillum naphthae TaxID=2838853 RepID=UPI0030823DDB
MSASCYTRSEILADGVIHALGVPLAVVAAVVLLVRAAAAGDALPVVAAAVYGLGLICTFGFSAAYNLAPESRCKEILRRGDHAAIYVMIAGTYTPFTLVNIGGWAGYGLLAMVWSMAAFGLALKMFRPDRLARLSVALYLALGWVGLVAGGPLFAALPGFALGFLIAGGVLYTVGVAFYAWRRLSFQNAIWHGFVLAAACCHYVAVFDAIIPG